MTKFLEGRHIYLRPLQSSDVNAAYLSWLNDPIVNAFSGRRFFPTSEAAALSYLENLSSAEFILAICTKEGKHIGNIKVGPIDWMHKSADLSILIGEKTEWGKGYGPEAIYLVTKHCFKTLQLHRLEAGTVNPAFCKSVEKLGWKKEGEFREAFMLAGKFANIQRLSLLNYEFVERIEFEI